MLRFLMLLLPFYFSPLFAEDCKLQAEAVVGFLDFEIKGCDIRESLYETKSGFAGTYTVDLSKLDTGLDLRNEHMRDRYLEVKKYPTAKLVLAPIAFGAKQFEGMLSLHGVTRKIKGDVLSAKPGLLRVRFSVKITDFGMEKPGYKGVVIGETINVFVALP